MLVLSRKPNQSIMIGDSIEISIVDIKGDQVKIGINAPRTVTIHRKEVFEEIQKENIAAANATPSDLSGIKNIFKSRMKKKNN